MSAVELLANRTGEPLVVWYIGSDARGSCAPRLRSLVRRLDTRRAKALLIVRGDSPGRERLADAVGGYVTIVPDPCGDAAVALGFRDGPGATATFLVDGTGTVRSTAARLAVPALATRSRRAYLLTLLIALCLLGLTAAIANDQLLAWDRPVARAVTSVRWAGFADAMRAATDIAGRTVLAPATAIVAMVVWPRCRQLAAVVLLSFPAAFLVEFACKIPVNRLRPSGIASFNSSFPSGHVTAGVVFFGLVPVVVATLASSTWVRRASVVVATVVVAAIALSRVYLGTHWPSDALGGVLAGAVVLLLADEVLRSDFFACHGCRVHPFRYGHRRASGAGRAIHPAATPSAGASA